MRIGSIASGRYASVERRASDTGRSELPRSHALVPVTPARRPETSGFGTRIATEATLIAQLLAIRADLPQTRQRRRASPAEAVAAYAGAPRLAGGRTRALA